MVSLSSRFHIFDYVDVILRDMHDPIFHVQSGHQYLPRLHVVHYTSVSEWQSISYDFDCLKFYASTHYRNKNLSDYKILLNIHSTGLLNRRDISQQQIDNYTRTYEHFATRKPAIADRIYHDLLRDPVYATHFGPSFF